MTRAALTRAARAAIRTVLRNTRTATAARPRTPASRAPRRAAVAAVLALAPFLAGCSTYDPDALDRQDELQALAPWAGHGGRHRILVAPVEAPAPGGADVARRAHMRCETTELGRELVAALTRTVGPGGSVALGAPAPAGGEAGPRTPGGGASATATEAWNAPEPFDLVLEARVVRWDVVFLDTNGWWWPNALFLAWYFWPIGQWGIADEVYGVDCEVELRLVGVASERELATATIVVRTPPPPDDERLDERGVVAAPRHALNDVDRGVDLLGTYFPGNLDPEQWEQVGRLMEPCARRVAAVRTAATVGEAIQRFDASTPEQQAERLATVHAVVVGISAYAEPCAAADGDAERFGALLAGRADAALVGSGALAARRWAPDKNVRQLVNGQATRASLLAELDRLAARAGPQDTLVLYFAGRGARTGPGVEGLRLLTYPSGTGGAGNAGASGDAVALTDLAEAVKRVPARHRLVVLDVDFEDGPRGTRARGPAGPAPPVSAIRDAFLAGAARGGVVLATGLGEDTAAQTYEDQGLLTQYVVRGLAGDADEDQDGLSYGDLAAYVERHVVNLAEVALPLRQRPLILAVSPRDPVR